MTPISWRRSEQNPSSRRPGNAGFASITRRWLAEDPSADASSPTRAQVSEPSSSMSSTRKARSAAALLHGSARFGFGSVAESVATTTGRVVDDPWIISVTRALEGERVRAGWRRWLQVGSADREFVHVTAAVNRESIRRHGLDWRRMSVATGIAGSRGPELEGIFLAWDLDDAALLHMHSAIADRYLGGANRRAVDRKRSARLVGRAASNRRGAPPLGRNRHRCTTGLTR